MTRVLTAHFTLDEFGGEAIPAAFRPTVRELAQYLETIRAAVGVPLRITSGWRDAGHNAAVGGVAHSQHLDGSAADLVPLGLSLWGFHRALQAARTAGTIGPWGQVIYYPLDGHIHLSLPRPGMVDVVLVKLTEPDAATGGWYTSALTAIQGRSDQLTWGLAFALLLFIWLLT